jgi:hypothetical protein
MNRTSFFRFPGTGFLLGSAVLLLTVTSCRLPPPGERQPAAGKTALSLTSEPASARISIDGAPTQIRTPATITSLSAGEHRIALTARGYRRWEKTIDFSSARTLNLDVRLEPTETGSLSVSSIPFQSLVFIDDRPIPALTPATIKDLPVGSHNVSIRSEGYEDYAQSVIIVQGTATKITASLTPLQGKRGSLDIRSSPPGASIFIDGLPTGKTTPDVILNLTIGGHTVELQKPGHKTWREEVTVREGLFSNLLTTLERSEPVGVGSVLITTEPESAEVILDSVQVRSLTPVFFETITRGTHDLILQRKGYQPWEGKLSVQPGEKTELHITLVPR